MAEVIDIVDYVKVADPAWEGRLRKAKENLAMLTIPAYIEFCQEVHAFRDHCDSSQGGSEFSKKGCKWLGCSQQQLSFWEAVGRRAGELTSSTSKLPTSKHAISLIASLDDIAFPKALERLEPDMTQKDVKELIKDINPPIEKSAAAIDAGYDRKARRIVKEIKDLPTGYQRGVWLEIKNLFQD